MGNQNQQNSVTVEDENGKGPASPSLSVARTPEDYNPDSLSFTPAGVQPAYVTESPAETILRKRSLGTFIKRADVVLVVVLILGVIGLLIGTATRGKQSENRVAREDSVASQYDTQSIPLEGLVVAGQGVGLETQNVAINGSLAINGGLVVTPSLQPSSPKPGQLYYDQQTNLLAYYNGTGFVSLSSPDQEFVETLGGLSGQVGLAGGLAVVGNQLINAGVLSLGGATGAIVLGDGLNLANNVLQNTGVLNITAGTPNVSVVNDGTGNVSVSVTGSGTGTVGSGGGTNGAIPVFTASQNIEDSIISQVGTSIAVSGDLNVTGALGLGTVLTVANGGTGSASLATNGVIVGNGTGALTSVTAGGPGLCLLSTAGAPTFGACSGGGGVTSLNGLTGALTIANASGAASTITINDATTAAKGIASFDSTNFNVTGGAVNTVQNINSTASPNFAAVNTNFITPGGALTVGSTAQTALLQGSITAITSTGAGNDIILNAADIIELQDNTNITGSLDISGGLITGTGNAFQINTSGAITAATGITSSGTITFSGLNCTANANGGALTTNGSGQLICSDDDGAAGSTITGSGTTGAIPRFTGVQTIADSIISQSGTTITIAGDLLLNTDLTVVNGGTGASTFTSNGVLYGNAGGALQVTSAGTGGQVLIANASGVPSFATFTGDVAVSNTGVTSIQTNSVALGTDTTGDYIANLGSLTGLSTAGNSGEGSTPTLSVSYGSIANTAVQGNITLTCPGGTGNLTGGGTSITLGAGGSCGSISTVNNPTFTTSVTSPSFILTGAGSNGTIQIANLGQATIYTLPDPVGAAATICISTGNCATAGAAGGDLTGTYPNPTIAKLQNTNLSINSPVAGHILIYNGTSTQWENHAISSDIAISETGSATIQSNAVALSADTTGNYVLGLTAGNGISVTGSAGEGWSPTVAVLYGSSSNTAVEGSTGITVTAGTNLTGGGSITLGAGGSVTLNVANSPTFSGTLTVQGATATVGTTSQQGSVVLNDGSSNTVSIRPAALASDRIYTLPDVGADASFCLTTGNCAGSGGGVTSGGGANNRLAKFTAGQNIENSTITDDGTLVSTTVDLTIQGGDLTVGTSSQLASFILHDGGGQTTTLRAGDSTGDLTFILPTGAGSANQCLKQSGTGNQLVWDDCDGGGGGSSGTLQDAYDNGNTIVTDASGDIAFTLNNQNLTVTTAAGATGSTTFSLSNGVNASPAGQLVLVTNNDIDELLANGIAVTSAAGGITDGLDVSDAEIVNAINIGANDILSNGTSISSTELNLLDGHDAALVDTNDAVNTAITGTGVLGAGSIASGFGAIDTGADNITTTGTIQGTNSVLTQSLDRTSAGALNIGASTATSVVLGQNTSLTGAATFTSGTGTVLLQGNTDVANTVSFATKRAATYTTAGSADDVALNVASLYILDTSGAAQTITGIAAGRDGQHLTLVNADAALGVTLSNNSGTSAAANRIITGLTADVVIPAGGSISLVYDTANSFWRVVGGLAGGSGTCAGCANVALSNLSSTNINAALNTTSGDLNLTTTTSGNIVLNSAGTIALQDNTDITGTLGVSSALTVTAGGLTVSAGGASITGNSTIASTAGNTLGLGNSTGAVTVTGSSASTFVINGATVDATEFNRLDGKDAALVDTNDAVSTAITGTGALGSGSITSGFGSIDTGADNITTTGTVQGTTSVLTQSLDRTSAGALDIGASTATSIVLGQNTSLTGAATLTSGTGTVLLQGNTDIANTVSFATKRAATYTTAGSANDVALNVASLYILDTSGAAQTITGIAAGRDGQHLTLINGDAALAVTISNNSGSSSAANRITTGTGADISLAAGASINLVYDTASSLWRLVGGVAGGNGTCNTCANQQLSNLSSTNINTALNATSGNLDLTTTTSGNIVLNSAGTIELQDNTNVTGTLGVSSTLTVTSGGLTVSAGGASITGNTTIASTAGNTLGLGNTTGAVTVTGSSASTFVINGITVDATEFNRLDGKDAALVDTNDAVSTAITGTGALNTGSITSGFGSIDVGTDAIQGGSAILTGANALTLGTASTNTGAIVLRGSGGTGVITLSGPTTPNAGNFTLTIPAITADANVCTDNSICSGYAPATGSGSYATRALDNLSSVAINTSLLSGSSTIDLGSGANPFRDLYLGGTATNNFRFTGTASAARTITLDNLSGHLALVQTAGSSSQQTGDLNVSGALIAATALQGPLVQTADVTGASTALTVRSGNSTSSGNTGAVTLATGNATSGTAGNISIDVGTSTSGNGSILIGTAARTQTITIGNSTGGAVRVGQNGGTLQLDGTNFDLGTTGQITLNGGLSPDITTAGAASSTAISMQPGTSTAASGAGASLSLKAGNQSGNAGTGGTTSLQGGNGTGTGTTFGGAVSIDGGTGTFNGAVNLATSVSSNVNIGSTSSTNTITIGQSTASNTINIGNGAVTSGNSQTVNIATLASGTGTTNVTIGSGNGASNTSIYGGTNFLSMYTGNTNSASTNSGNITLLTGDANGSTSNSGSIFINVGTATGTEGVIGIGTTRASQVSIGNTSGTTLIQSGTGNINLNNSSAGDIVATLDADSNFQFNATGINANINPVAIGATYTGDQTSNAVDVTVTNNSNASTGTLYGLNVNNADNSTNTGVLDAIARFVNNQGTETVPDGVFIQNSATSGTLTNGLRVSQGAAGTTTNGIQIVQSAGTLSNGLRLGGTMTNGIYFDSLTATADIRKDTTGFTIDLNNASNSTLTVTNAGAGVASISLEAGGSYAGVGALTVSSGGSAGLSLDSASGRVSVATGDFLSLGVSGVTGAAAGDIWYDTSDGKFKINEASGGTKILCNKTDLACGAGATTPLQTAYNDDVDGGDSIIALTSNDDGIIIRNPSSGGSDSTYNLVIDQLATGAKGGLSIQSAGTGNLFLVTDTTSTAADVFTIADGGASTFKSQTNSANAFRVLDAGGTELDGVDTTANIIRLFANNTASNGGKLSGTGSNWNTATSLPGSGRFAGAAVALNGYLYQIGGCDSGGATDDVYYAQIKSDGSLGSWTTSGVLLPANLCGTSATTYNGYIFVHGGAGSAAASQDIYYTKPNADGSITSWKTQDNPSGLADHVDGGIVAYNGYLYATAGTSDDGVGTRRRGLYYGKINADGSVPAFSVQSNWLADLDFNPGQVTIANGYIYVMGTANYDKFYFDSLNELTGAPTNSAATAANSGTAVTDARKNASIAVLNGYMYAIGGGTSGTATFQYGALTSNGDLPVFSASAASDSITLPAARDVCSKVAPVYNNYVYMLGCADGSFNPTTDVYYASGARVKVGGSLDLLAYSGEGASEGQSGGQLTAGNTFINGLLSVSGNAVFRDGLAVNTGLSIDTGNSSTVGLTALNIGNSSVGSIFKVEQMGTNFGSLVTAGGFMGLNSYLAEEFTQDRPQITDDGTQNWGNGGGTAATGAGSGAFFSTAENGTCLWDVQDGELGGAGRITANATATACASQNSTTTDSGTINAIFDVDNLPVIYMKVRPSVNSTGVPDNDHQFFLGLTSAISTAPATDRPTNFIGFTNCSDAAGNTCDTTWRIQANDATAPAACATSVSVSETVYAVLVIKVLANNNIQFWIDGDASNGINLQLCGTITSVGSTAAMSAILKADWEANSNASFLDVDYFRAWQDDVVGGGTNPTEDPNYVAPLTADSGERDDQLGILDFTAATSEDQIFNHDVYVRGTLFADKIRANQIEGVELYASQLSNLQQRLDELETGGTPPIVATSMPLDLRIDGSLTVAGKATFQDMVTFKQDLALHSHLTTQGDVPVARTLTAAGNVAAPEDRPEAPVAKIEVIGNDTAGQLLLRIGEQATAGEAFELNFTRPFAQMPRVFITPVNANATKVKYYIQSTPTGFKLVVTEPLTSGQDLQFNYLVLQ